MNVQKIAQKLVDELQKELNEKTDQGKLLTGAIQGVNLLYSKLIEAGQEASKADEQGSKPKGTSKKAKAKK